jgi:hypothetical protein
MIYEFDGWGWMLDGICALGTLEHCRIDEGAQKTGLHGAEQ